MQPKKSRPAVEYYLIAQSFRSYSTPKDKFHSCILSVSLNTTLRSEMPLLGLKYHSHGQILPPVTKFMIDPGINQKPTDPE